MKKLLLGLAAISLVLAVVYLIYPDPLPDQVRLLTIKTSYIRYITHEDETLSIPIYVSQKKSFLTDEALVSSALMVSGDNQIALDVLAIEKEEGTTFFDGENWYLYRFSLGFENKSQSNYFLQMPEAWLTLTYRNNDQVRLCVGDVSLRFSPLENPPHLDLYRMYATTLVDDFEYVSGVVLGLTNLTMMDLEIIDIDLGWETVIADLDDLAYIDGEPETYQTPEAILGHDLTAPDALTNNTFLVAGETLLYLPLIYTDGPMPLGRFPIIITYRYQDQNYTYIIDDFRFFSPSLDLEAGRGRLEEFVYHY